MKEAVSKAQEQLEKALPVIAEARALKTKMEAAMPNLKEKKEALELAQKENQTAQKDVLPMLIPSSQNTFKVSWIAPSLVLLNRPCASFLISTD